MQKFATTLRTICLRSPQLQASFMKPMSLYTQFSQNFGVSQGKLEGTRGKDLIEDIRSDHKALETYYESYKSAKNVEEGHKWFNLFLWEVCRHSAAEEIIVYNMMEFKDEQGKKLAHESREDHRKLKQMLEDLRHEKDEKKFEEKFDEVYKSFQDHVKSEEGEDHPYIQKNIPSIAQLAAAKAFAFKKNLVPTRPHPGIPDKPTTVELALGMLATPVDKLKDLFTSFPDKKDVKH